MKIVLFANSDWYLYNFRRSLALALRERGDAVLLLSPAGPYGEKLLAMGFRWIPVPMERRSLNPIKEIALMLRLRNLLRRERADLVHSFTIKSAIYGSLAANWAHIPARVNAVTGMGYVFISNDPLARVLRPLVRALMRLALDGPKARLILQNRDDVDLLAESRLIDPARVRIIRGSGVNCTRFVEPFEPAADGKFRVLLVARLLWDKGLAEYVAAARTLKRQGRRICFLLAGAPDLGNPASVPEATAMAWMNEGLIEWLGHVEDMPSLLASADVVVLPSYREGLPKSLIEAAACARPLVATDVPGCREVVTHEVDGLLIPPYNSDALADAIARLQDDPALARSLGQAAQAKAIAEFDEQIVIARTLSVYNEIVGQQT